MTGVRLTEPEADTVRYQTPIFDDDVDRSGFVYTCPRCGHALTFLLVDDDAGVIAGTWTHDPHVSCPMNGPHPASLAPDWSVADLRRAASNH